MQFKYNAQPETLDELGKLTPNTVSHQSAWIGYNHGEPLLVAMDAMLRYAKAYATANESLIGGDGFASDPFKQAIQGIRALLNMDGGVAFERDRNTDSKDNGVIEALYWHACREAGIDGDD